MSKIIRLTNDNPNHFDHLGQPKSYKQRQAERKEADSRDARQAQIERQKAAQERLLTPPQVSPPFDVRQANRKAQDEAARRVKEAAASKVAGPAEHWAARAIPEYERELASTPPAHKRRIQTKIQLAKDALAKHQREQAEIQRKQEYANYSPLQNAKQHAEAFRRSPPPGEEHSAAVAVALLDTTELPPAELVSMYFREVHAIEARGYAKLDAELKTTREATAKQNDDLKIAEAKLADVKARAELAAAMAGEKPEPTPPPAKKVVPGLADAKLALAEAQKRVKELEGQHDA